MQLRKIIVQKWSEARKDGKGRRETFKKARSEDKKAAALGLQKQPKAPSRLDSI